ncbi:F-box domain-containing protein [Cedratvirus Zaza IHUMI]|uniref:F-box domain-containing protein n=1 Tax=Cedratvirus Zaza IHUMI TaxID=2126979 RepID=A0A2R8FEA8_9VIRU|nr:F-box domain-containing protein [Cedratvirus Zaza IHUMI]
MQDLPIELQEEILFSFSQVTDLARVCSSSRQSRQICSSASFWRAKFRREGLPLLEEGSNFSQWLGIYDRSLKAVQVANAKISSGQEIEIALSRVANVDLVKVLNSDIEDLWEVTQKGGVERYIGWVAVVMQTEITVIHDYYIVLYPQGNKYMYGKIDKQEEITEYGTIRQTLAIPNIKIALSKDDTWFMIYRLVYHGYPF